MSETTAENKLKIDVYEMNDISSYDLNAVVANNGKSERHTVSYDYAIEVATYNTVPSTKVNREPLNFS